MLVEFSICQIFLNSSIISPNYSIIFQSILSIGIYFLLPLLFHARYLLLGDRYIERRGVVRQECVHFYKTLLEESTQPFTHFVIFTLVLCAVAEGNKNQLSTSCMNQYFKPLDRQSMHKRWIVTLSTCTDSRYIYYTLLR